MTVKLKTTATKKKPPPHTVTAKSIETQTAAFLKAGGEIQRIASGVSGQQNMAGPKHIILGNKSR